MSPPLQAPQALGSKASGKDPSVSAEGDTSQGLWPLNLGQAGVEPHLEAHPCRGIFSVAGSLLFLPLTSPPQCILDAMAEARDSKRGSCHPVPPLH